MVIFCKIFIIILADFNTTYVFQYFSPPLPHFRFCYQQQKTCCCMLRTVYIFMSVFIRNWANLVRHSFRSSNQKHKENDHWSLYRRSLTKSLLTALKGSISRFFSSYFFFIKLLLLFPFSVPLKDFFAEIFEFEKDFPVYAALESIFPTFFPPCCITAGSQSEKLR